MASPSPKNNILFIIADDLGKLTPTYGNPSIHTPNLDALAASGIRFTSAFASTASCSASRSTIYSGLHTHQTGQYGHTHAWNHFSTFDYVDTAPAVFNRSGYQTGIVGKVHVAPPQVYPWEFRRESGTRDVTWVAEQVEEFLAKAESTERAFYLTVGFVDPHRDTTRGGFGNEEFDEVSRRLGVPEYDPKDVAVPPWLSDVPEVRKELAEYYRSISRFDAGVGLLLKALEKHGLVESTLVIVCSDNGPPFINSKTTLYEAGICLPLFIRCPGLSGKGLVNPNLISYIDFLPTLLDWAGAKAEVGTLYNTSKQNTDYEATGRNGTNSRVSPPRLGVSFLPILEAESRLPADKWQPHVFGSHTFHEVQNYWPTRYVRTARWKYHLNLAWRLDFPFATDLYGSLSWDGIRNTTPPVKVGERPLKDYIFRPREQLFDLDTDPLEVKNLVDENGKGETEEAQKVLEDLRGLVTEWQQRTGDPWLYRDGVSVVCNEVYAAEGLRIPERAELDVERPGNRDVEVWEWKTYG